MDCVIAAGGRPEPDDPLYTYSQGRPKALIEVGGRTMLEWVTAALHSSHFVDRIVVVGLDEIEVQGLVFSGPTYFISDQGGLVDNVRAGIQWIQKRHSQITELLISTVDIPLLTGPMISDFVERCRPFDYHVYYNVITRGTMERYFPDSRRTFVRLKGTEVAGGDVVLTRTDILQTNQAIWQALTDARKHAWRLAWQVGPWTVVRLLARQLTLEDAEQLAGRLLGQPVKVLQSPYAELGMDVDKPHHLALLQRHLNQQTLIASD